MIEIDFEWWRDELGYELLPAGPPDESWKFMAERSGGIVAGAEISGIETWVVRRGPKPVVVPAASPQKVRAAPAWDRIAALGGKLVAYRPLQQHPGLWRVFALGVSNKEELLEFVRRFGPLSSSGNR